MTIKANSNPKDTGTWTFLSNHGHVLVCLARDPEARLRDVARNVGITERAVQRIVSDLEQAGILTRHREGRRNRYSLHGEQHLRHPVEAHTTVSALLETVLHPANSVALELEAPYQPEA